MTFKDGRVWFGESVVATDIKPQGLDILKEKYVKELLVRKLDVSKEKEIKDAFAEAIVKFGRVDIVFNNAGYTLVGEIESIPFDDARKFFDVLFWGAAQVSLEAVKTFREANGGRLITTSSMMGVVSSPIAGYYSAAKHALEGFSVALASELDPAWDIKITLVEPAMFRTGGIAAAVVYPTHPAYDNPALPSSAIRAVAANPAFFPNDPAKAAGVLYRLSTLPEPPLRLALGKEAVAGIKDEIEKISTTLRQYESWSENLTIDV
ncbi:unnamed protein product [Somion occarium]|uniref:Uncharacterized protein n=1 Tax=Somion occarium TaxID=3059160 RepID=A0ABP1DKK6_9APHY